MRPVVLNTTTVLLVGLAFAQQASVATTAQPLTSGVDAVVRTAMQTRRIPGVAVAVVEDGRLVLERAYGFANLERTRRLPPTPSLRLRR